nr:MAG TPA: hypothetical protein [Caudoviricetes sp.]
MKSFFLYIYIKHRIYRFYRIYIPFNFFIYLYLYRKESYKVTNI